jgi:hypothetical protein
MVFSRACSASAGFSGVSGEGIAFAGFCAIAGRPALPMAPAATTTDKANVVTIFRASMTFPIW